MKNTKNVGFIFKEKELIYLNSAITLDIKRLYTSNSLGNTTKTSQKKED